MLLRCFARVVLVWRVDGGSVCSVRDTTSVDSDPPKTFDGIRFSCSRGKMRSRSHARSRDSKIVRFSFGPCCTNLLSNLSRNSRAVCRGGNVSSYSAKVLPQNLTLSSGDSASSPTTAFIAAASLPMAYMAYCIAWSVHQLKLI